MSSKPVVTFEHAGGVRTLEISRIVPRTLLYSFGPSGSGDRGQIPGEYSVVASIFQGDLDGSFDLAYQIAIEAETAVEVTAHDGSHLVDGLSGFEVLPDGQGVELVLRFIPTGIPHVPPDPLDAVTFDSTKVTWDNVSHTWDASA